MRRTAFTHVPYHGVKSVQDHRALVALLREGAPASAIENAAREHKLGAIDAFTEWLARRGPAVAPHPGDQPGLHAPS